MRCTRRTVLASLALAAAVPNRDATAQDSLWTPCAAMPVARSEMQAVALDGVIYVAGGFGAANLAHAFDPETDKWSTLPDLPVETNHPGTATWNGHVVVAGGYSSDGAIALDGIWALKSGDASWEQIGTLPHPMGAFGFAEASDLVFVVGGAIDSLNGHPTDETWSWDPATDTWSERSPVPRGREHLAMATREGLIYVVGGRIHGQASPELGEALDIYDPAADLWAARNPLSPPRSGLNGANTCAGIAVAGGETPSDVFADVNLLDPVKGEWTSLPDLPTAVHGAAVATVGTSLFLIGGSMTAGAIDNTNEVWRLQLPCDSAG